MHDLLCNSVELSNQIDATDVSTDDHSFIEEFARECEEVFEMIDDIDDIPSFDSAEEFVNSLDSDEYADTYEEQQQQAFEQMIILTLLRREQQITN